jgi:hypothetical protein
VKVSGSASAQEKRPLTAGQMAPAFHTTDQNGKQEAFFETAYTDHFTANNLLLKLFPELEEGGGRSVPAPHVGLTLSQSDQAVVAGSPITIGLDVTLPEGVHVDAPGVTGYKPISLQLEPAAN